MTYSWTNKAARLVWACLVIPTLAHAHRGPREVVFKGEPVIVRVKTGEQVHVSVPFDIAEVFVPAQADRIRALDLLTHLPRIARFVAVDPPERTTLTILTAASKPYAITLLKSENPDTYVTILDAEPQDKLDAIAISGEGARILSGFQDLEASPLNDPVKAMWYAQWGRDPRQAAWFGIHMQPRQEVLSETEEQRVTLLWSYEGADGVYGFTLLVENKASQPLALDVRRLTDPYGHLYSVHLDGVGRDTASILGPGTRVRLHLVYVEGAR